MLLLEKTPKNENPDKIISTVENIVDKKVKDLKH